MNTVILWLDDVRDPKDHLSSITNIVWIKTYNQFIDYIKNNPLPDFISFDHDLGYEYHYTEIQHIEENGTIPENYKILYDDFKTELTGFHCAKWLVDYCIDNNLEFPNYTVHSQNPVGKENIEKYIENYKTFSKSPKSGIQNNEK